MASKRVPFRERGDNQTVKGGQPHQQQPEPRHYTTPLWRSEPNMLVFWCELCCAADKRGDGDDTLGHAKTYRNHLKHLISADHQKKVWAKWGQHIKEQKYLPLSEDRHVIVGLKRDMELKDLENLVGWLTEYGVLTELIHLDKSGIVIASLMYSDFGGSKNWCRRENILNETLYRGHPIEVYKWKKLSWSEWNYIYSGRKKWDLQQKYNESRSRGSTTTEPQPSASTEGVRTANGSQKKDTSGQKNDRGNGKDVLKEVTNEKRLVMETPVQVKASEMAGNSKACQKEVVPSAEVPAIAEDTKAEGEVEKATTDKRYVRQTGRKPQRRNRVDVSGMITKLKKDVSKEVASIPPPMEDEDTGPGEVTNETALVTVSVECTAISEIPPETAIPPKVEAGEKADDIQVCQSEASSAAIKPQEIPPEDKCSAETEISEQVKADKQVDNKEVCQNETVSSEKAPAQEERTRIEVVKDEKCTSTEAAPQPNQPVPCGEANSNDQHLVTPAAELEGAPEEKRSDTETPAQVETGQMPENKEVCQKEASSAAITPDEDKCTAESKIIEQVKAEELVVNKELCQKEAPSAAITPDEDKCTAESKINEQVKADELVVNKEVCQNETVSSKKAPAEKERPHVEEVKGEKCTSVEAVGASMGVEVTSAAPEPNQPEPSIATYFSTDGSVDSPDSSSSHYQHRYVLENEEEIFLRPNQQQASPNKNEAPGEEVDTEPDYMRYALYWYRF